MVGDVRLSQKGNTALIHVYKVSKIDLKKESRMMIAWKRGKRSGSSTVT